MVSVISSVTEGATTHSPTCPEIVPWTEWSNGPLNKVGWQPEPRMPLKYMEKDLLLGMEDGLSSRGEVGTWNAFCEPRSAACFPEALGEGMRKELCPFREGWKAKWCKSNGWSCLWSFETCTAVGCVSFPLTLIYVYIQNESKDELRFPGPLIQDLFSCSQRRKANALSHFNT